MARGMSCPLGPQLPELGSYFADAQQTGPKLCKPGPHPPQKKLQGRPGWNSLQKLNPRRGAELARRKLPTQVTEVGLEQKILPKS